MIGEKNVGGYTVAGQPTPEEFAALKERGITTVVNVRLPGETETDERAAVEALGFTYISVPFNWETLSGEHIDQMREALGATPASEVLIH
jgi:protein tyrosine phosphatase (PTP) superfamily phosphohydrolase (DUF442 family)